MPHAAAIDGFDFARSRATLNGARRAGDFARLREHLSSPDDVLQYELQGLPEWLGRPALRLQVSGRLALRCQRCLGPLDFALCSEAVLLLCRDEAELEARPIEAEGPDYILGGREMPVLELVEDEVLLAIPPAPRHERCAAQGAGAGAGTQRPFAGLRGLMGGKH
jgi:uncharacterized protein